MSWLTRLLTRRPVVPAQHAWAVHAYRARAQVPPESAIARLRRAGGYAPRIPTSTPPTPGSTRIAGRISAPAHAGHTIFLGLFPQPTPEGAPIRCAVMPEPGTFRFDGVPDGTWYLLCHATAGDKTTTHAS